MLCSVKIGMAQILGYTHVEICMGYITMWRSLHDLHTKGQRPEPVEAETPSDITDLYHGI